MRQYDLALAGASLSACAAACRLKRDGLRVLLLEKGILAAPEFTSAFQAACTSSPPEEPETAAFCTSLRKRGILTEEGLTCAAVHPVVCHQLRETGVDCLFRTRIQEIRRTENVFRLTLISLGKELEVSASVLCDATPDSQLLYRLLGKPIPPRKKTAGYITTEQNRQKLTYHTLPVPDALPEQELISWFYAHRKDLELSADEKIVYIANRFAETADTQNEENAVGCLVMPAAFTLQQAYDTGIRFAERMVTADGIL